MQTDIMRPNRRPKLFLPRFLAPQTAEGAAARAARPFPLSRPELRRVVAEMMD